MYRLLNWLFGWDYIRWSNGADTGIARVRTTLDGDVWYRGHTITSVMALIVDPEQVQWLTCSWTKYLPTQMKEPVVTRLANEDLILRAVARGWCSPENQHKEMDTVLASAIAKEVGIAVKLPGCGDQPAVESKKSPEWRF